MILSPQAHSLFLQNNVCHECLQKSARIAKYWQLLEITVIQQIVIKRRNVLTLPIPIPGGERKLI